VWSGDFEQYNTSDRLNWSPFGDSLDIYLYNNSTGQNTRLLMENLGAFQQLHLSAANGTGGSWYLQGTGDGLGYFYGTINGETAGLNLNDFTDGAIALQSTIQEYY